jgi:hypothetical protein
MRLSIPLASLAVLLLGSVPAHTNPLPPPALTTFLGFCGGTLSNPCESYQTPPYIGLWQIDPTGGDLSYTTTNPGIPTYSFTGFSGTGASSPLPAPPTLKVLAALTMSNFGTVTDYYEFVSEAYIGDIVTITTAQYPGGFFQLIFTGAGFLSNPPSKANHWGTDNGSYADVTITTRWLDNSHHLDNYPLAGLGAQTITSSLQPFNSNEPFHLGIDLFSWVNINPMFPNTASATADYSHTVQLTGISVFAPDKTTLIDNYQIDSALGLAYVPEPSTLALLGSGIIGLMGYGWRRLKK